MGDDVRFEDAESYSFNYDKDKLTFRDIVLQHLRKITQLASVEFRGGYWEVRETPVFSGGATLTIKNRVYVPDTRECYSNAVEVLADLLAPYFDEEMRKAEEEAVKALEKALKSSTVLVEPTRVDEFGESEKGRVFRNEAGKVLFRDERVKVCRRLFRALCSFLYRKKYLDMGVIED